jgi:hypothetical protein
MFADMKPSENIRNDFLHNKRLLQRLAHLSRPIKSAMFTGARLPERPKKSLSFAENVQQPEPLILHEPNLDPGSSSTTVSSPAPRQSVKVAAATLRRTFELRIKSLIQSTLLEAGTVTRNAIEEGVELRELVIVLEALNLMETEVQPVIEGRGRRRQEANAQNLQPQPPLSQKFPASKTQQTEMQKEELQHALEEPQQALMQLQKPLSQSQQALVQLQKPLSQSQQALVQSQKPLSQSQQALVHSQKPLSQPQELLVQSQWLPSPVKVGPIFRNLPSSLAQMGTHVVEVLVCTYGENDISHNKTSRLWILVKNEQDGNYTTYSGTMTGHIVQTPLTITNPQTLKHRITRKRTQGYTSDNVETESLLAHCKAVGLSLDHLSVF